MTQQEIYELLETWDNIELLVAETLRNTAIYTSLLDLALQSKEKRSWRAAYLVDKINDLNPELLLPHLNELIEALKTEENQSKKRHYLKLISQNVIPESELGFLFDFCITHLRSESEPIAVRVHAMQVLFNISEVETDLKPEVLHIIEHEMKYHPTAGILSRGKRIAKKLSDQIPNSK